MYFVIVFRMRNYVKRGAVSNRVSYARLRDAVWAEVYSLDKEGVVLHDCDIQNIAMEKAQKLNLVTFKVSMHEAFYFHVIVEFNIFLHTHRQAMDGHIILKRSIILSTVTLTNIVLQSHRMMMTN